MDLRRIIKEYFENSSLHGAKFIVDQDHQIGERIFWCICVILCWIASGILISITLDAYNNDAISFVVDTAYRDWNTEFPSVVICETRNMDRIQKISDQLWGTEHDFLLEELLTEIVFFRGESYQLIHECNNANPIPNCIVQNFSDYAELVRSSCHELLVTCKWNDLELNCCKYFQQIETELGLCYGLNSKQIRDQTKLKKINLISNRHTGPGRLYMELLTEANIFTLGEEDVPNLVTPKIDILTVTPYIAYTRKISVKNIDNDPLTRDVSVEQRKCRYSDENILNVHKHYSYSACSVQCRKDFQIKKCNCTSHLIPNIDRSFHCNISGLACLNYHYEELSIIVPKWNSGRKGIICDCLPSCTEIDITVVHDSTENIFGYEKPIAMVEIELSELPTERYKRNVVRGKLDLVVSMGGTTGLFVGASILSFVEIFYYFTIRPYNNARINRPI